ncbi:hypothetical protein Droror1_Dr00016582, partial [Drosera rotundifolia]
MVTYLGTAREEEVLNILLELVPGGAPVIAGLAKAKGILTIGIVTIGMSQRA